MKSDQAAYRWKDINFNIRDKSLLQTLVESCQEISHPWHFINIDSPCLHIWRIHKNRPVPLPVEMVGQFFTSDVYILLNISLVQSGLSNPQPIRHIHVWVGKTASEADYKAGFFWSAQLDGKVQEKAILHREIQGLESQQFRGYFCPVMLCLDQDDPEQIRFCYWRGQFEDGYWMKNVRDEFYGARLLKLYKPSLHSDFIVGKEVSCSAAELDPAFTFVLDTGRKLFIWHGNLTPTEEDLRCTRFVEKIRADRGCDTTKVEALDDDTETDAHEFFTYLGKRNSEDGDYEVEGSTLHKQNTVSLKRQVQDQGYELHKLSKDKRVSKYNVGFDLVKKGKQPLKELEKYPVCFYGNQQEVFVVMNKKVTKEEWDLSLQYGHDFLKTTPLPYRELTVLKSRQPIMILQSHLAPPKK